MGKARQADSAATKHCDSQSDLFVEGLGQYWMTAWFAVTELARVSMAKHKRDTLESLATSVQRAVRHIR